ncbi:Aldo/kereductase family [Rhizoctonia solani]|uniref:Aldo/kereductase family n=1 Tax=Rhizoctonia solani TaxID=456999 RepID=A0A8H7M1E6_9AGAM|nr:Aldo/kereductase family [Rhizoctonia solani]
MRSKRKVNGATETSRAQFHDSSSPPFFRFARSFRTALGISSPFALSLASLRSATTGKSKPAPNHGRSKLCALPRNNRTRPFTVRAHGNVLLLLLFVHLKPTLALVFDILQADHYGSAELLFGQFRQTLSDPSIVVGATKWCVFAPTVVTRAVVEEGVRERMERMKYDKVDLLQPMPKTHAPASVSVSVPAQTNMLLFPAPAAVGSALQGRIV